MVAARKYKKALTPVQKIRLMRAINMTRWVILKAVLEEDQLDMTNSPQGQQTFVHRHRRLQKYLAGHFPYIEIREDAYASDIADMLAKDLTHYVLHGDTPGGT